MRLVLDTNIWLDWLVFDDPHIAPLRAAQAAGELRIFIDAPCTEELRRVLAYRLRKAVLAPEVQAGALDRCLRVATSLVAEDPQAPVPAAPLPLCRDPDDQKFLDLAHSTGAALLLSKDRDLLGLASRARRSGLRILTPGDYARDSLV